MGKYKLRFSINCLWITQRCQYAWLCYKSLTYNIIDSFAETAFEPVFLIVDFVVRWFGRVFVFVVICLVTSVVVIFYICIIPIVLEVHFPLYAYMHLCYGHYLLVMIAFNYYKAVTTKPGKPPSVMVGIRATSICKRCFLSKPPRTHHCSICKACRLKMDHHCPWLNNCVGHFNHRYFILFCTFMCMGTIYVSLSSWSIFRDCFHAVEKFEDAKVYISSLLSRQGANILGENVKVASNAILHSCSGKSRPYNNSVVYLWILCSSVTVALGCLTLWHAYLISKGETSIERLINKKEQRRLSKINQKFRNPYDLGIVENWKHLLGVHNAKTFLLRVVLPSSHPSTGDGVVWTANKPHSFVA